MNLREIRYEGVNWTELIRTKVQWRDSVNTVIIHARNFSTSSLTISWSLTSLHGKQRSTWRKNCPHCHLVHH